MKVRIDFTAILAVMVVLYCNGGMLSLLKGSTAVTLLIYGAAFVWLGLAILKDRSFTSRFVSVSFFVLVFFALLNIFAVVSGSNVAHLMSWMRKNLLFLLMFVAIFIYYSVPRREVGRRMLLYAWAVDTVVAAAYTIYRLIEMPILSRILATGTPDKYLNSGVSTAGVLGYGSIYGLVFIIIAIVGVLKETKQGSKVAMIGCIVLFSYTIIQAQFFLATVLGVFGVILSVAMNEKITWKKLLVSILSLPVILLLGYLLIGYLLPALAASGTLPIFIAERLKMFLDGVSIAELMGTARGTVYFQSISAIAESWGLGILLTERLSTGEHSEILDLIAVYGIPMAALFSFGIWRIKKFTSSMIPNDFSRNYNIVWVLFLMMSLFNTSLWCQTTISVFLMLPLLYIEFDTKSLISQGENVI